MALSRQPALLREATVLTRRSLLMGLTASSYFACRRTPPPPTETKFKRWRGFKFPSSRIYSEPQYTAVLLRKDKPLLFALHGRGEAGRGLKQGARGWRDDYELNRVDRRLAKPPLTRGDFYDLVDRVQNIRYKLVEVPAS